MLKSLALFIFVDAVYITVFLQQMVVRNSTFVDKTVINSNSAMC